VSESVQRKLHQHNYNVNSDRLFRWRSKELQHASEALKKGWTMLNEHKEDMLGRDKHDAFQAFNEAKEHLDREWDNYKRERQKAYDNHQREHEQKQQAWRRGTEENIRYLEDRRDRLNSVLSHKESHLEDLRNKLSDAWSDDYRSRVSGWIDEEESNIQDIRDKLSNVEDWLHEARSKLNS
jgi:predicted  nucleic acid-binding Zn-ribbon protein